MSVDVFVERLAKVRGRFMATLESKIEDSYAALASLSGQGPAGVDAVAETYRRVHGICGIGPTVGFGATANAARDVESVLLPAYRAERALAADELAAVETALHALRAAARQELRSNNEGAR